MPGTEKEKYNFKWQGDASLRPGKWSRLRGRGGRGGCGRCRDDRLKVGSGGADQFKFGFAVDGVQKGTGDAVVNFRGFFEVEGIADDYLKSGLREAEATLRLEGFDGHHGERAFHMEALLLHSFFIVGENGIDGAHETLLDFFVIAFGGEDESDLMPDETGVGNLLEETLACFKDH